MKRSFLKKCISLLIGMCFFLTLVTPVYAKDNSIHVQLNGENISFDVAPKMVNNRIMVPMRAVFEKLGSRVDWDSQTGIITATYDETVIKLTLNSRYASVTKGGAESLLQLDSAPSIVDGRTLVPVRFVSESLGKQVGWDEANRTVVIIDYSHFVNALETQASNFYEYLNNQYEVVNTGEMKSLTDVSFKYIPSDDPGQTVSGEVNANLNAKLNKKSGSMDVVVKITGLQEVLKGSGLENYDNISFNIFADNNSFYVKSNLFPLLEQFNIRPGNKWIKADIADLKIPDVKTFQDLKEMQNKKSTEQILNSLKNIPMELDGNSFAEAQALFDAVAILVDNNHFTVTNNGDVKLYTWNINKEDLVDVVLNINKSSEITKTMTLQDLVQIKQFTDSLEFDFNMQSGVKNNIVVSSKTSLDIKMDIPDVGYFEMSLKGNSEVVNPNNSAVFFNITLPDENNVINYKDLVSYNPL